MALTMRTLRLKAVWLIVLPFLWFSRPTVELLGAGAVLAVFGLWIRGWSAGTIHKDEELTTSGPYSFTRNPLYVGSFFVGVGVSLAGGHWIWPAAFLLFFGAVYTRTMAREAEQLARLFGDRYAEYSSNVPAFLPRLTPYHPSNLEASGGFRWSQYKRNREWEAPLGAFAAFGFLAVKAVGL